MPIIRLPYRKDEPPSLPVSVSGHGMYNGKRKRVRARFGLSVTENYLSNKIISELNLFPHGKTVLASGRVSEFYFIDLHFTVGLLGNMTEQTDFRGLVVIPSDRLDGLIVGMDLIRRGRLTVDADGIIFCY